MDGINEPNDPWTVGHNQACSPDAIPEEPDTPQQAAVSDASRSKDDVVAWGKVVGGIDAAKIYTHCLGFFFRCGIFGCVEAA
jgi:hypothetical protein